MAVPNDKEVRKIESMGWTVESREPLAIYRTALPGSRATGLCAEYLVNALLIEYKEHTECDEGYYLGG